MNTRKLLRKAGASFTAVAAGLAPIAMLLPTQVSAAALTSMSDTLSRLEVSVVDVTHTIVFTPTTAINQDDGVQITIPAAFGDTDLDVADYSISQGAGGTACAAWTENAYVPANGLIQFECDTVGAAGTGAITVTITTDLDNPATVGEQELAIDTYDLGADSNFAGGDDVLEDNGVISVYFVDDDTVNVTGYIDTFISFDIDTTEVDEDCDAAGGATPCDTHGGATDNSGYVVSLGELTTSAVNDSGDTVMHADNVSGEINSIYFNLDTNADGGAVVTVDSLNGQLTGPGANAIPSVVNGANIAAGDGAYGINIPNAASTTSGTIVRDTDCDSGTEYCEVTTSPTSLFTTSGDPVAGARVEVEVAASPDAADGTGTYTDQLTFVATATY